MEEGEIPMETALREVREETGISLAEDDLGISHNINKNVTYYVTVMRRSNILVQETVGNDANSIAWISIECLQDLISQKKMRLNSHARILGKKIFRILS
jgi:ADP-ribose pyrophosphatase YjhB (NUDIX family)